MEIGISAYSGQFSLTLNSYQLPISKSEVKNMPNGSWHDLKISYDRAAGTMEAYLDNADTPIISKNGMNAQFFRSMSDIGEYFYVGSDPDDPNRTFPGAIDDLVFGTASASTITPTPTATSTSTSATPVLAILPETGKSTH
jgi:hypothetical protein